MQSQLSRLQPLLDIPYIRRVRRNHGLEHATIHMLAQRIPNLKVVGRSDGGGFWLYGDLAEQDIRECADKALGLMRDGQHELAIHPNCGTNLVTVAFLGTLAALAALIGSERERFGKIQRIPLVAAGILFAAIVGQPLGLQLQEHITTLGDPGDLTILEVKPIRRGNLAAYRVRTRSS